MSTGLQIDTLPRYDLSDLYGGISDPEIGKDWQRIETDATAFATEFKGRLADLGAADLKSAITRFETLQESMGKIYAYAYLEQARDLENEELAAFYQGVIDKYTAINQTVLFFSLELNSVPQTVLDTWVDSGDLGKFAGWLISERRFEPYQLSEAVEQIISDKDSTGRQTVVRLFNQDQAMLRPVVNGTAVGFGEALNLLQDSDGDTRRSAGLGISAALGEKAKSNAVYLNTLIQDKHLEDKRRGYTSPSDSRHLANQIEPQVVDTMVDVVTQNYAKLSHRYYRWKAKFFGKTQLDWWDRNAPLPLADAGDVLSWEAGKKIVLDAFGGFCPKMAATAEVFFEKNWIDARPAPSKDSGAFSHPVTPSTHPYILMNYHGKKRDVLTLAHELGHGVHQVYAAPKGYLLADTPLTIAETASIFGEMLTFQSLLKAAKTDAEKIILLSGMIEDKLNTVVRQVAFHHFEVAMHTKRQQGELGLLDFNSLWLEVSRKSLGDAIILSDDYAIFWSYISHIFEVPFYVYAYAFGDGLVNALYGYYKAHPDGFVEKYTKMLESGGSRPYGELLAEFGFDASKPEFWQIGVDLIAGFIDELEALGDR